MYRNRKRFEREKNRIACNHLEHNTCLVNKDGLYRTMRAYCAVEGREPMDQFMPLTFHVTTLEDEEWTSFKAAFTKHTTGRGQGARHEPLDPQAGEHVEPGLRHSRGERPGGTCSGVLFCR